MPVFGTDEVMSGHPYLDTKHLEIGKDVLYRDVQRTTAAYYAMVETVDSHIGKILEKLDEAGQNGRIGSLYLPAIMGKCCGEHGIWAKHKFYESGCSGSFLIRFPARFAPRRVKENVNLCDLYATLCELCSLDTPDSLDSRSLVPLMTGNASYWDNESITNTEANT